jgi:hypothetical protein
MTPRLPTDLRECWDVVVRLDRGVMEAMPCPLAETRGTAAFFGLEPLPERPFEPPRPEQAALEKPTFRGLTEPVLLSLRRQLYAGEELGVVARWAETNLRFCEVRMSSLEQRASEKCGGRGEARLHVLHLASFLLDHGSRARDARFLNTVLKLLDARWLVRRAGIRRGLARSGGTLVSSLFQLRLLMVVERALLELSPGHLP